MITGFSQNNGLAVIRVFTQIGLICEVRDCEILSTPGGVACLATDAKQNTYYPYCVDTVQSLLIWKRTGTEKEGVGR